MQASAEYLNSLPALSFVRNCNFEVRLIEYGEKIQEGVDGQMEHAALTNNEIDILTKQCLNIGEAMYCAGAEISRIEDTLYRLGKAYGAEHVSIYALTSSIVVTMEFPGEATITQSRRIRRRDSFDLKKLEVLNSLSRECTAQLLPVDELRRRVLAILEEQPKQSMILLGEILAASAFAVFFGGALLDALAAAAFACCIYLLQRYMQPLCQGRIFFNIITSFLVGSMICGICRLIPVLHAGQIMIGDIMVLIPGIAITNSMRYALSGDSISGIEKLIDSVLLAGGIAVGFTLAIYFVA